MLATSVRLQIFVCSKGKCPSCWWCSCRTRQASMIENGWVLWNGDGLEFVYIYIGSCFCFWGCAIFRSFIEMCGSVVYGMVDGRLNKRRLFALLLLALQMRWAEVFWNFSIYFCACSGSVCYYTEWSRRYKKEEKNTLALRPNWTSATCKATCKIRNMYFRPYYTMQDADCIYICIQTRVSNCTN